MEESRMRKAVTIAIALNIIAVAAGAGGPFFSTAPPSGGGMTFQQCYVGCFVLCAIQPTQTLSSCGFECLRDCLIPQNNSGTGAAHNAAATPFHFCNLGCASTHCTNLSTLHNPGGKEVAGCVGFCSGICRKKYITSPH